MKWVGAVTVDDEAYLRDFYALILSSINLFPDKYLLHTLHSQVSFTIGNSPIRSFVA